LPCANGGPQNTTRDVWYKFTAIITADAEVRLCQSVGAVTDSVLGVYSGACAGLTLVACDDNGCQTPPSMLSDLSFPAVQGPTYYIRVASWGTHVTNQGQMTLEIHEINTGIGP
jgi:hypothetical protein